MKSTPSASADGEPLIVLPGLLCDGAMFADALQPFVAAVVVGDHYAGADRIETMADHVIAAAPDHFALLGHSMGAQVALEIARRAPGRVKRLMLADTGIHPVAQAIPDATMRVIDGAGHMAPAEHPTALPTRSVRGWR